MYLCPLCIYMKVISFQFEWMLMYYIHEGVILGIKDRQTILTISDNIRWHNSTILFVPSIFIVTDNFNFSSNLTVAAEWKTIDTFWQMSAYGDWWKK